jgi:hypothetical protein
MPIAQPSADQLVQDLLGMIGVADATLVAPQVLGGDLSPEPPSERKNFAQELSFHLIVAILVGTPV